MLSPLLCLCALPGLAARAAMHRDCTDVFIVCKELLAPDMNFWANVVKTVSLLGYHDDVRANKNVHTRRLHADEHANAAHPARHGPWRRPVRRGRGPVERG